MDRSAIPLCTVFLLFAAFVYANPSHDLLSKATDAVRNKALLETVNSAAYPCSSVTKNFFRGFDKNGMPSGAYDVRMVSPTPS